MENSTFQTKAHRREVSNVEFSFIISGSERAYAFVERVPLYIYALRVGTLVSRCVEELKRSSVNRRNPLEKIIHSQGKNYILLKRHNNLT